MFGDGLLFPNFFFSFRIKVMERRADSFFVMDCGSERVEKCLSAFASRWCLRCTSQHIIEYAPSAAITCANRFIDSCCTTRVQFSIEANNRPADTKDDLAFRRFSFSIAFDCLNGVEVIAQLASELRKAPLIQFSSPQLWQGRRDEDVGTVLARREMATYSNEDILPGVRIYLTSNFRKLECQLITRSICCQAIRYEMDNLPIINGCCDESHSSFPCVRGLSRTVPLMKLPLFKHVSNITKLMMVCITYLYSAVGGP